MSLRILGFRDLATALLFGFSVISAVGLGSGLLFRGGFVLRWLGFALVTADGSQASYARIAVRSIVTWTPAVAICVVGWFTRSGLVLGTTIAATLMLFAAGIISAIQTPSRGWPDRIAGTHLVPE